MIIYDCEIRKAIKKPDEPALPGIEYCEGWRDFRNMGISVICAYDYDDNRFRVFTEDNIDDFIDLAHEADTIVGFNSLAFDNPLCRANNIDIPAERSWDLLAEIWAGAGLSRQFAGGTHKGFGLDLCAKANFGKGKSGNGAQAPIDWQRGRLGSVIDYCLQDVTLTRALLNQVIMHGYIRDPRDPAKLITVARPEPAAAFRI